MSKDVKIYVAIDTPELTQAVHLADMIVRNGQGLKLGLEFFSAQGPEGVRVLKEKYPDLHIFLDLKFHDIPNTVAGAVRAIASFGIDYANIHASGGSEMMFRALDAAREGAEASRIKAPKLLAVTLLSSLSIDDMKEVGLGGGPVEIVTRQARLAHEAGFAGVVCSPGEIGALRREFPKEYVLMVPGIRPDGDVKQEDQKRIMTPSQAIQSGATHLVVGRPITEHSFPEQALRSMLKEIG